MSLYEGDVGGGGFFDDGASAANAESAHSTPTAAATTAAHVTALMITLHHLTRSHVCSTVFLLVCAAGTTAVQARPPRLLQAEEEASHVERSPSVQHTRMHEAQRCNLDRQR